VRVGPVPGVIGGIDKSIYAIQYYTLIILNV
jgi:hypothetical protein